MDYWKNVATGISRTGLLGVGLLGLYLGHKQRIPDFLNMVSYGVTFAGIYVLTNYLLNSEDSDDRDKNVIPSFRVYPSETPKRKNTRKRRMFLDEYDKATKWVFEKRGDETSGSCQQFFNIEEVFQQVKGPSVFLRLGDDTIMESLTKGTERFSKTSAELEEGEESVEMQSSGVLSEVTEKSVIPELSRPLNTQKFIDTIKFGDIRQKHNDETPTSSSTKFDELDTD